MKVLITGGAGFIGSNYVYVHQEKRPNDELVVLDALTYAGDRGHLADAEAAGARFVEGRIEDRKLVNQLFDEENFDLVVHFAAESHVDRSIESADLFTITNVMGTQVLLDAARDHGVHFHHISTDEVYGDAPLDSDVMFYEDSLLKPSNPYSASKAASDLMVLAYHRTYQMPITLSRCSNNYGPFQHSEKFIAQSILNALSGQPIPIYGEGLNMRDWLFVTDHCEAVLQVIEKAKPGSIYNIGAHCERKNIDVAKLIVKLCGASEELITFVEDRKGHDLRYPICYDKLHEDLGWQPSLDFEEGLRKTIEWYKMNPDERSYSSWRNRITALSTH